MMAVKVKSFTLPRFKAAKARAAEDQPPPQIQQPDPANWSQPDDRAVEIINLQRTNSAAFLATGGTTDSRTGNVLLGYPQELPEQPKPMLHPGIQEPIVKAATGRARVSTIERRLSEDRTQIRDVARRLAVEMAAQVEELRRSRPNDGARLAAHDQLVAFLERMATGLAELANALEKAVTGEKQSEPVFLGTAAKIADGLYCAWTEWFEENRTTAIDVPIRLGTFAAGVSFLHWLGADSFAAIGGLAHLLRGPGKPKTATKQKRGGR